MNDNAILLDAVEKIQIDPARHFNEFQTLQMLTHGLMSLATGIRRRETRFVQAAKKGKFQFFGATSPDEKADLQLIACIFHWFGVSLCNYARLVGFLRGLEKNLFTRDDLQTPAMFNQVAEVVKAYVESIPELEPVLLWRNKVAGHFAITAPHKTDNIATLNTSVMFPVTLEDGIYHVGGMKLTQTDAAGSHTSVIPMWSVSQVFESLVPRFWPGATFEVPKEAKNLPFTLDVPNREVLETASRFRHAANMLFQNLRQNHCISPFMTNSALALELYLKSLNCKNVHYPIENLPMTKAYQVHSEPIVQGHPLTKLYDALIPELKHELDALYAKSPLASKVTTMREALEAYDDLFVSSRYWFERKYAERENCNLTRLHELVNLIGHHVENLPQRIATDEKPD